MTVPAVTPPDLADTVEVPPPQAELAVRSHGLTDRGRVRANNEDQFLIAELSKELHVQQSSIPQAPSQRSSSQGYLFVVADGMGGHAGGQEASERVVRTVEGYVLDTLQWFLAIKEGECAELVGEFQRAIRRADAEVFAQAGRQPELRGMGSTLTLAFYLEAQLFVLHVGDSRAYLWRSGRLYRLTHDHTLPEEMVRQGLLPAREADHHPLRHVITNVVGGPNPGVHVEVTKLAVEPGDQILLCSDGLTSMVPDAAIATILAESAGEREACERLVGRANELGGHDNITVVVARFTPVQSDDTHS